MKAILIIALIVFVLTIGPIITIWALNLLFGLAIQTSFATWFATLWLTAFVVRK